jgi:hypothetical protein
MYKSMKYSAFPWLPQALKDMFEHWKAMAEQQVGFVPNLSYKLWKLMRVNLRVPCDVAEQLDQSSSDGKAEAKAFRAWIQQELQVRGMTLCEYRGSYGQDCGYGFAALSTSNLPVVEGDVHCSGYREISYIVMCSQYDMRGRVYFCDVIWPAAQ